MNETLALLEQQKNDKINEIREAQRQEEEQKRQEDFEKSIDYLQQSIDQEEELRQEIIQENFLKGLETEQERDAALQEVRIAALNQRLALLDLEGKTETAEAKRVSNEILKIKKEQQDLELENERKKVEAKRMLEDLEYQTAKSFLALGMQLLDEESQGYKAFAAVNKAITIAEMTTGLQRQIAGIRENSEKNPVNALIPGFGPAWAAIRIALAVANYGAGVAKVAGVKFEKGGFLDIRKLAAGGVLQGPRHAQGGIPIEAEGGEYFINRQSTQKSLPALDVINANPDTSFMAVPMHKYVDGGQVTGNPSQSATSSSPDGSGDLSSFISQNNQMMQKLDQLIGVIEANADSYKKIEMPLLPLSEELNKISHRQRETTSKK